MEPLFTILIFATTMCLTPGPNSIMLMASGLNFGISKTMPHYLGVCLGFPMMAAIVGFGFGVIFDKYPVIHQAIKIIGIAYLLYLSWLIANSAPRSLSSNKAKPLSFLQAVIFQWLNPKAWMMATSAVAAYTSTSLEMTGQVLIIALVFFLVGLPCMAFWLVFGASLKNILKKNLHQKIFNLTMASLLVISIFPVVTGLITARF